MAEDACCGVCIVITDAQEAFAAASPISLDVLHFLSGSEYEARKLGLAEAQQITGWAQRRVELPPGMTGLWQTTGRNDVSFEEMVRLDFAYVTNWSLWWDLKILCRTIPAVLSRRGAY